MKFERSSGVLLHVSSLPGPYGTGDLGPVAHDWVDWLADAGCRYWQVLPLGPPGSGNSPYSSFSSFAGNIGLISPEALVEDGLVTADETKYDGSQDHVDHAEVLRFKRGLVRLAHERLSGEVLDEFNAFVVEEAVWLEPYTLFMALKYAHGGDAWTTWPDELRFRKSESLESARAQLADEIARYAFGQFVFYRQLSALQDHAGTREMQIIGDIPLYVASDSVDVWRHPQLFTVDTGTGLPELVAGVPPDMFSPTGQLWGNPLYRWEEHVATDFEWWTKRFEMFLRQADVLRLDHFTGFVRYYSIHASDKTADRGVWREGPGVALFNTMTSRLGDLPVIVEDLGPLGRVVEQMRLELGYPGMKVLQEAFEGDPDNPFHPDNYPDDCVVYTGTHDLDTARGRFETETEDYRRRALAFTGTTQDKFSWGLIEAAWESVAVIAIAPVQDLLDLGSDARMNVPATVGDNWQWRMSPGSLTDQLGTALSELNNRTDRR